MKARLLAVCLIALVWSLACSDASKTALTEGPGSLGEGCNETEDCASGLCVRRDAAGGICTVTCSTDASCPQSANWGCVRPSNFVTNVCACVPDSPQEICGDGIDNECNGRVDDCLTCGGVAVPESDPSNCGACGNACRADQECSLGSCRCGPDTPTDCASTCVDLSRDVNHCGACGAACGPGQRCAGSCVCPDPARPDACPTGCFDFGTDPSNCGRCGNVCGFGKECVSGQCVCPFGANDCGGTCVDIDTDVNNCGSCGNACGVGQACVAAQCGCNTFGRTACGDSCVDTQNDTAHCGLCDNACAPGEICSFGGCFCQSGLECSGACVPVDDPNHCGSCGNACHPAQVCRSGGCQCPAATQTLCGGACTDLQSDDGNCGACGTACRPTEGCRDGICECPAGRVWCDQEPGCVDLSGDASHCGACGNACNSGEVCNSGTCECPNAGELWCASVGGCVQIGTDPAHCGSCDSPCQVGESCTGGVCACPNAEEWCPSVGMCIDTRSEAAHCGGCDQACRNGEICSNGGCTCPNSGERWCASVNGCIDTLSNDQHCGLCDLVCPADSACGGGVCRCDDSSKVFCDNVSACIDVFSDPNHCLSCLDSCQPGVLCLNGNCHCPNPTGGTEHRVTTSAEEEVAPVAVWSGSRVGVAYLRGTSVGSRYNLYFALLNPDGTKAVATDLAITTFDFTNNHRVFDEPDIVWTGTEFGVLWTQDLVTSCETRLQRIDANGTPIAAPVVLFSDCDNDLNPLITWSDVYGGYAIVTTGGSSDIRFQRIGADGTSPETPNFISTGATSPHAEDFQVNPSGGWGVITTSLTAGPQLIRINADGSRTLPINTLKSAVVGGNHAQLSHDGTDWLATWWFSNTIEFNYGSSENTPVGVVRPRVGELVRPFQMTQIAADGRTVSILWQTGTSASSNNTLSMRRFDAPMTPGSYLPSIGQDTFVLPSQNFPNDERFAMVHTPTGLIAVWPDDRLGPTELFARAMDFGSCPSPP